MAGLYSAVTSHVNRALTALTTDLLALLARYDRDSDQQHVGDNAARVTRRGAPAISRSAPTPREDVTRSSSLGSGTPAAFSRPRQLIRRRRTRSWAAESHLVGGGPGTRQRRRGAATPPSDHSRRGDGVGRPGRAHVSRSRRSNRTRSRRQASPIR